MIGAIPMSSSVAAISPDERDPFSHRSRNVVSWPGGGLPIAFSSDNSSRHSPGGRSLPSLPI
jgi:hypothetical protein